MTEPINDLPSDDTTTQEGPVPRAQDDGTAGVRGGDADRLDAAPGSGGVPSAGADGETAAREQLRKDLGERAPGMDTDEGTELADAATLGGTE